MRNGTTFEHSDTCGRQQSRASPIIEQLSTIFCLSVSEPEVSAGFTMVASRLSMPSSLHTYARMCPFNAVNIASVHAFMSFWGLFAAGTRLISVSH